MAKLPHSTKQWVLRGTSIDGLTLEDVPLSDELGEYEVLVKFHAASLNYRDVMITTGTYKFPQKEVIVPISDGAGEVISVGLRVTRFTPGQRVTPTFIQSYIAGPLTLQSGRYMLGGTVDGVLRQYGAFPEDSLVEIPPSLSYMEAATLPCAALTAWNALYGGAPGRILKPGDTALTQGTGGVSIFALQFARAGGAEVISTTSSPEKAAKLKALGATHVIDYKADPEWGATAKQLSQGQRGVDFIVEIGGSNTLTQSANASAGLDSTIAIIGQRAQVKGETAPNPHSLLTATRRIIVGNRLQFEEMNRAIEANHIKPVIDAKTFGFTELKEALAYLESGEHFGKIVLKIE